MKRDVKDPESVADHMYRMGLMALIASDIPGLDRDKFGFFLSFFFQLLTYTSLFLFQSLFVEMCVLFRCIKMAIVHDIAEGELFPFHFSLLIVCLVEKIIVFTQVFFSSVRKDET